MARTPQVVIQPVHSWTDQSFLPADPSTPAVPMQCQDPVITSLTSGYFLQEHQATLMQLFAYQQSSCNAGMDPVLFSQEAISDFSPFYTTGRTPQPTSLAFGVSIFYGNEPVWNMWENMAQSVSAADDNGITEEQRWTRNWITNFTGLMGASNIFYDVYSERILKIMENSAATNFTSVEAAQREIFMAAIDNDAGSAYQLDFWRQVTGFDLFINKESIFPNWRNQMHLAGSSLDSLMDYAEGKKAELLANIARGSTSGWSVRSGKLVRPDMEKISLEDYFNNEIWTQYAQQNSMVVSDPAQIRITILAEAIQAISDARLTGGGGAAIPAERRITQDLTTRKTIEELGWEWTYLPIYWMMQIRDGDFGRYLARGIGSGRTPPPPPNHCNNHVQDQGETGMDCGGTCGPCGVPPPVACTHAPTSSEQGVMQGLSGQALDNYIAQRHICI